MIVFASNPDYIKTSYVTAEWEAFVHDINSDHKPNGKLVTILTPDIEVRSLPAWLRNKQSFTTENYKEHLAIIIKVYHKHKSSESKVDSGNYIIEIRIKTLDDLKLLDTGVLQESDGIRFLNFKHISVSPAEIENEIIEIGQENGLRFSERILPYCRKSIKGKREESSFRRLTLYKSGKTFRAGILKNEINDHHKNALIDITYDIRSVPYDFAPHMVMAKLHIEARNCHLCDHCIRTEDVTWCNIVKNGSTRKGTFKVEKGRKCSFFQWNQWLNSLFESYSKDLIEGKDFHIWKVLMSGE
jgi:hypothetical protein